MDDRACVLFAAHGIVFIPAVLLQCVVFDISACCTQLLQLTAMLKL